MLLFSLSRTHTAHILITHTGIVFSTVYNGRSAAFAPLSHPCLCCVTLNYRLGFRATRVNTVSGPSSQVEGQTGVKKREVLIGARAGETQRSAFGCLEFEVSQSHASIESAKGC